MFFDLYAFALHKEQYQNFIMDKNISILPNFTNEKERQMIKDILLSTNKKLVEEKSRKYSFDFFEGVSLTECSTPEKRRTLVLPSRKRIKRTFKKMLETRRVSITLSS